MTAVPTPHADPGVVHDRHGLPERPHGIPQGACGMPEATAPTRLVDGAAGVGVTDTTCRRHRRPVRCTARLPVWPGRGVLGGVLILALLSSALLATRSSLWLVFTLLQLVAYALAAACWRHSARGGELPALLRVPAFLFALNWAFLVASLRFARGRFAATWASTPR